MLKKSIELLKKNPVIILFYFAYLLLSILILFALYPKNFNQLTNLEAGTFQMSAYMIMMGKMMLAIFLLSILGLLFLSGYGNMMREALLTGKTSAASFVPGLKKYFSRVLLAFLLLAAIVIGLSILISIITVPITIMLTLDGATSVYMITMLLVVITFVVIIIPIPFIILWFPALFMEDIGIMRALKYGAKAGAKNYLRLLLSMLVLYAPQAVNVALNYDTLSEGNIFTVGYLLVYAATAILSVVFNSYIFIIYHEYRKATSQSNQVTINSNY